MKLLRDNITGEPLTYNDGTDWKLASRKDSLLIPAGSPLVTVGDLKNQTGVPGPHPILYCGHCGAGRSSNAGDYWDWPKDHVFVCCDSPMQLGKLKTTFEPVTL